MASVIYNGFKKHIMNGDIDMDTDTIKVLLVTVSYTPDIDAHEYRSSITNEVANGNGYTTGGVALANKAVTFNTSTDKGVFDADDSSWTSSTFTARAAVLYKARGGASSADELICYVDFAADKSPSSGTLTITWDATGILTLS